MLGLKPATPNLPRFATSVFGWSGGMNRLKIIQNKRLTNSLEARVIYPQFNIQNFKLSVYIYYLFPSPIR